MVMRTADLMDEFQDELQSCEIQFKSFGKFTQFHGPCRTIKCKHDNVLLKKTLEEEGQGQVLVVDGEGSLYSALLGDMIADIANKNGWAGVIIYGAIRDSIAINEMEIGIKALGTNPRKSKKEGLGAVDVPLRFGGVSISPGDWLYSDEDGIVIAKRQLPA
jgi:regulator of ribonuclease activity A